MLLRLSFLISLLAASTAWANSFSFSYVFTAGTSVGGTFEADRSGDLISNVTNLVLTVEGYTVPGTLFLASADGMGGWLNTPVFSFDLASNNFIIADTDWAAGDIASTASFYILEGGIGIGADVIAGGTFDFDFSPAGGTWKLIDLSDPTSVPDGGATAGLLLGTLGFALFVRRKLSR